MRTRNGVRLPRCIPTDRQGEIERQGEREGREGERRGSEDTSINLMRTRNGVRLPRCIPTERQEEIERQGERGRGGRGRDVGQRIHQLT